MSSKETVGLGVDIVEIARMKAILERSPRFREKVFSDEERAYCDGKSLPEIHYATRFAAKEAVLKALGTGFSQGIGVRDVEVGRNAKGRPYAILHGRAREVAQELGIKELPLSLSYTHTEAVACAMAITEEAQVPPEVPDPTEELGRRFKEMRSLLDDLPASGDVAAPGEVPAFGDASAPGDVPDVASSQDDGLATGADFAPALDDLPAPGDAQLSTSSS